MERWNGRHALVTGASSGIGAEICRVLVGHGLNVIGCARDVQKIRALEQEVAGLAGKLHPIQCDLSKESEILAMFAEIKSSFKSIDICINNAGFNHEESPLLSGQTDIWRRIFEVNVLAPCICTREAVKLMEGEGHIINISSLCDRKIPPGAADTHFYAGTKSMILSLTEGLRNEVKSQETNIGVSIISPGLVKTEFLERCWGKQKANNVYCNYNSLNPEDIAAAVVYALTSRAQEVEMSVQAVERKKDKKLGK